MKDYELTPEEQAIVLRNSEEIMDKTAYYFTNIRNITAEKALAMAKKHVTVKFLRRDNPLYGHDEESLNELYEELKAVEDAETGADREFGYDGPDCTYLSPEEVKAYVIKHGM